MSKTIKKQSVNNTKDKNYSSKNAKSVPISTYDFTSYEIVLPYTKKLLNDYCKKWVFQLEECPTTKIKFPKWHLTITSNENIKNDFYVIKEDSRVDGPWKDDDEEIYIPLQVRNISKLFPWQQKIIDDSAIFDTRTINVIFNEGGNIGKSILSTYCGVYKLGRKIPYSNDFKDIMRIVMDTPTSKLYIFDIPKAIKKEQLCQFYAGIEEIKNGYAFDDRYKFREKWFDCPSIWIFTNKFPNLDMLSSDRWKIWTIVDNDLITYVDNNNIVVTDTKKSIKKGK